MRSCPTCSNEIDPAWVFCPACGQKLHRPAPPPARPQPGPLPDDFTGPCALLRTTGGDLDIARVGRVVAEATGQPLADVTVQIKRAKGVLARDIDADAARRVLPELERLGVPARIVPADRLLDPPPVARADGLSLQPEGLRAQALLPGADPMPVHVPWERVLFLSAARLRIDVARLEEKEEHHDRIWWRKHWLLKLMPTKYQDISTDACYDLMIDICIDEPSCLLRLRDARLDFQTMQRVPGERAAMVGLAQQFERCAPCVPRSTAFRVLFDESRRILWDEYTYLTPRAVDDYTLWLYNLVRLGFDVP